jgi:predicted metal-dependent hydrolase
MASLIDEEFGTITLRRSAKATHVRLRVAPDGRLRASLPLYAPLFLVKRLIKTSRPQLRAMLSEQAPAITYTPGMQIGKSHTLIVRPSTRETAKFSRHGQQIIAELPIGTSLNDHEIQRELRDTIIAALRVEAKSYLPKRLAYLAAQHGYSYKNVRFSHAGSRWGSCSTNGTISLNIALMKLPFELIDYVLIHELSHTREMNHSTDFWAHVANGDPAHKQHRAALKKESPSI